MIVRVLLFGPYAAAIGSGEVSVAAPDAPTGAEVLACLSREHVALGPLLGSARLAVNHVFAPPGTIIREGDEVAVIGMVSGG